MGILGERNEPLLNIAINDIIGAPAKFEDVKMPGFEVFSNSKLFTPAGDNLFVELPTAIKANRRLSKQNK